MGTVLLYDAMRRSEDEHIEFMLEEQTLLLAADVRAGLMQRQAAISRTGRRLGVQADVDQATFDLEAQVLLDDFPHLDLLMWSGPDGARWSVARPGSPALGDALEEAGLRAALRAAEESGVEQYCDCVPGWDGSEGLALVVPVDRPDGVHFLIAVFRLPAVLGTLYTPGLIDHQPVIIEDDEGIRFSSLAAVEDARLAEPRPVALEGLAWRVRTGLHDPLGRELRTALPEVVLLSGLLLAGMVTTALWFFGLSRRRAAAAEEAREALESEMEVRRKVEAALRESEERFRSVFDRAAVGIALVDHHGVLVAANPAIGKMLGYRHGELVGRSFAEFSHPESSADNLGVLRELLAGERGEYVSEERFVRRSGEEAWGRISATAVRGAEGETRFVIGLLEDVTEQRRARGALEAFATRLERSNEDLERFASVVAHDLREPLVTLRLYAEEIRHAVDEDGADLKELADRMASIATRMDALILAVLRHAQVTTQRPALEPVALEDVVGEAVAQLRGRLAASGGHIEVGALPVVEADGSQMRQLFQNLLLNALKFSRPGVAPRIRVEAQAVTGPAAEDGGPRWRIRVVDNGVGLDPADAERIFEEFTRARPDYEGTGMGLSICRRIVEQHGGRIRARPNAPEPGTTIEMVLPAQAPRAGEPGRRRRRGEADGHRPPTRW